MGHRCGGHPGKTGNIFDFRDHRPTSRSSIMADDDTRYPLIITSPSPFFKPPPHRKKALDPL
ncbi:hypothetical protein KNP414_02008 [Paenibacillus mucilaginosus KNP414]|uniref:Uncharacterized protein n=1 Tax=Paenibacillus mucilaginosus (strain KNP414) TaxID=1036673 RepID=F8FRL2_PAEMK|nr:hypothetical protein KNP414_02008 [Paenibacillus mucilaginosus KNP414]